MRTIGVLFSDDTIQFRKGVSLKNKRALVAWKLFSSIAKKKGFNVLLSNLNEYSNGQLKKAYSFDKKFVVNEKIDAIFDRSISNKTTDKFKKKIKIKIINHPELNRLCWDKLASYKLFHKFMPKTFLKKIKGKVVVKPRYGIAGTGIKITNNPGKIKKNYIVQEFVDSSKGYKPLGIKGIHDFRVLIINGKIDHCYARIAKKGSLFANCSKGGTKKYIKNKKIPKSVISIIKTVDNKFKKYGDRVYSVDFAFINEKPMIMELESKPGFAYYDKAKKTRNDFLKKIIKLFKTI